MQKPVETQLSWDDIRAMSKRLAAKIQTSGFAPDCLIGITVGGLFPLGLLSKELGIVNVTTVSANSYKGREQKKLRVWNYPAIPAGQNVLLVDEVADSGRTLREVVPIICDRYAVTTLKTAVLVVKPAVCTFAPDYFDLRDNNWIKFPWEKLDE